MADINKYKNYQKMMQDPERKKTYNDVKKRRKQVPNFKEGGYCKGAGAAIKGTKFEGVF